MTANQWDMAADQLERVPAALEQGPQLRVSPGTAVLVPEYGDVGCSRGALEKGVLLPSLVLTLRAGGQGSCCVLIIINVFSNCINWFDQLYSN